MREDQFKTKEQMMQEIEERKNRIIGFHLSTVSRRVHGIEDDIKRASMYMNGEQALLAVRQIQILRDIEAKLSSEFFHAIATYNKKGNFTTIDLQYSEQESGE